MRPTVTLRQALADPALLGGVLSGDSWQPWRVLLIAAMGEALNRDERRLFWSLTKRLQEPGKLVEELWCVIGRRGGKSRALAVLAVYLAALVSHEDVLAPGETGVLLCIAPDMRQATIILNFVQAIFEQSPILKQMVVNRTSDSLELSNHISIEVRASNFRRLRGPTYIGVIADEAAFWMDAESSSNPDTEILNSIRPGLATTSGMLVVASSPYARKGELYNAHKKHYGEQGDASILVAQAESRLTNPSLSEAIVTRAYERDPASAAAEYGGLFRSDLEAFVSLEAIEACVARGVFERPPVPGISYESFCDPAGGGSGGDSMALAIGHREGDVAIIDVLRERRPRFIPTSVIGEFVPALQSYGITKIVGDRFAGEWAREPFRQHGIIYLANAAPKSDLYLNTLPLINSGKVQLLDHPRLVNQLVGLERRSGRGRDAIDHAPNGHDDLANSVAGVITSLLCARPRNAGLTVALPKFMRPTRAAHNLNDEFRDDPRFRDRATSQYY